MTGHTNFSLPAGRKGGSHHNLSLQITAPQHRGTHPALQCSGQLWCCGAQHCWAPLRFHQTQLLPEPEQPKSTSLQYISSLGKESPNFFSCVLHAEHWHHGMETAAAVFSPSIASLCPRPCCTHQESSRPPPLCRRQLSSVGCWQIICLTHNGLLSFKEDGYL